MKKALAAQPPPTSLADALFSGTRQRVLRLLFGQPERSYYATELIALAASGSGAVQRELASLAESGLVTVRAVGNRKHYQANPESPIYAELCGIVRKTFGLAEPLREALAPLASRIRAAFVYGSVAKGADTAASDIDLMVVSDTVSYADTYAALEDVSAVLGRQVNPTILTTKDLAAAFEKEDAFTVRVWSQPKVWVIGSDDDVGARQPERPG
ncbi:MAG: nucleotidyltransferase domain-containing protein [Burkholderiaceae bacterium]|nr:nucleotidyltransferase domain-containing protein [Burkholderiaceae bacterium]